MAKVVLDAVGGDHAPAEAIRGVALALQRGYLQPSDLILTGPVQVVKDALAVENLGAAGIAVVDAPDLLAEGDSPTDALRKKPRNSIAVGMHLVKEGKAQSFISAGSTGTVVAAATVGLRCLEGIRRPGIAAIIHGEKNPFLVMDVGANPMPKARHLLEYAVMGSAYYEHTFGVPTPRVGLLNIGSEELKGNPLVKEARGLIKETALNFAGNVEGVELFSGNCHVVITDGFTGNVLLKSSEGVAEYMLRLVVGAMHKVGVSKELVGKVLAEVMPRVDYSEYGGALLLGVEGIVTICHGRSQAPAFCNAIRFAMKALSGNVNQHIVQFAKTLAVEGEGAPAAS